MKIYYFMLQLLQLIPKMLQDCYPRFVLRKIMVVVMVDSNPFYVLWKFHIL